MGQYLNPGNIGFASAVNSQIYVDKTGMLEYDIAQSSNFKKNLNRYHVIQLDIAELKVTKPKGESVAAYLQRCVAEELYRGFPASAERSIVSLPLLLAEINEKTKEQFIIVIDEWDAVFREDLYNKTEQDEYIDLLRGLFMEAYQGDLLLVGINYNKDSVDKAHTCVIEKLTFCAS